MKSAGRWRISPVKAMTTGCTIEKAHLRRLISQHDVLNAPMVAYPLGVLDCCGVSDGAACAIVTTVRECPPLGCTDMVVVKSMQLAPSNGWEMQSAEWDGAHTITTRKAAQHAYAGGRYHRPAARA